MQPQTQINLPMVSVANFIVNMASIIAIDLSEYEQGVEGRSVELLLVGPHSHVFTETRADEAYLWYLQISGQARVQPIVGSFGKPT